jgi:hypothetical protein
MPALSPDQYSFLLRQEALIVFGLDQVLYGVYAILVMFLAFFCKA